MLLELHGWLPDLIEAHLESLDFLFPQWVSARASSDYAWAELARMEERIEANLDALVLAGDEAEALIEASLASDSRGVVTAAALVSIRNGVLLFDAWDAASPAAALAIGEAYGFATELAVLEPVLDSSSAAAVVGAAYALTLRGRKVAHEKLSPHLVDGPDRVRALAWRVMADLVARSLAPAIARRTFEDAFADEAVADAAWWGAAWSRQSWLSGHATALATRDVRALRCLAQLGGASDRARVIEAMNTEALGLTRFDAAASLGQVDVADALLIHVAAKDPATAVAASRAFWRMTDQQKLLDASAQVLAPGEDDPDLAETVHLPDVAALKKWWSSARGAFAAGPRWARATDVDKAELTALDGEARTARFLREVHGGKRAPELALLERYPLVSRG